MDSAQLGPARLGLGSARLLGRLAGCLPGWLAACLAGWLALGKPPQVAGNLGFAGGSPGHLPNLPNIVRGSRIIVFTVVLAP